MLVIEIDDRIEEFNQRHYQEIQDLLRNRIEEKLQIVQGEVVEILTWMNDNLEVLLKGKVEVLRTKISEFNQLIDTLELNNNFLTQQELNTSSTVDDLKNICRESNISGFSNLNKQNLITHILNNEQAVIIESDSYQSLKKKILFINCELDEIFEDFYSKEWDKIENYDRYKFVYKHGLKTCPYCNRSYIFILKNGKVRPEIDHFFPKSIYPYLAMSFYNLIPSCQTCNHTKKAKDSYKDNLKSPYEISSNDFKFTYKPSDINFLQARRNKYNSRKIRVKLRNKIEVNDEYFKLEKFYKMHNDIVLELIIKKLHYPSSYVEELEKEYGLNKDEIYRYLMCSFKKENEFNKRPLSKLIKDISEELELI